MPKPMPVKPDLSTWLSKPAAAARLAISERTLERMVAAGKGPQSRQRTRRGKRPETVYNPQDVETLADAAGVQPFVMAPEPSAPQNAAVARTADGIPPALAGVLSVIERLAQMAQRPSIEPASGLSSLWLTLDQAAAYTGLSRAFLKRLVDDGKLPAIRDRATKVKREHLDLLEFGDIVSLEAGGAE